MSKKFPMLLMTRTQHTDIGHLRTGIAYRFDPADPRHITVHKKLVERGFAETVTEKDLDAMKAKAEALNPVAAGSVTPDDDEAATEEDDGEAATEEDDGEAATEEDDGEAATEEDDG